MTARAMHMAVGEFFCARLAHFGHFDVEMQRLTGERMVAVDVHLLAIDLGHRYIDHALRAVSRRVEELTEETGLGVLAITHYTRLLSELHPDRVHVLSAGRIVTTGGPELADELERTGYAGWVEEDGAETARRPEDPFADPLA